MVTVNDSDSGAIISHYNNGFMVLERQPGSIK